MNFFLVNRVTPKKIMIQPVNIFANVKRKFSGLHDIVGNRRGHRLNKSTSSRKGKQKIFPAIQFFLNFISSGFKVLFFDYPMNERGNPSKYQVLDLVRSK